jgi:hypothetical protein
VRYVSTLAPFSFRIAAVECAKDPTPITITFIPFAPSLRLPFTLLLPLIQLRPDITALLSARNHSMTGNGTGPPLRT